MTLALMPAHLNGNFAPVPDEITTTDLPVTGIIPPAPSGYARDWQPRNWLVHNDVVSVIDFGRAAMRPALTDFARLAVQEIPPRPQP